MGKTQFDIIRRQAEAAAKNAVRGAAGRLRRETSLVGQAGRLTGRAIREGEAAARDRVASHRRRHVRPSGATVATTAYIRPAADGYVRHSPVQPIHEAADYRRRIALRVLGTVALAAAVLVGIGLLSRLGVFGR